MKAYIEIKKEQIVRIPYTDCSVERIKTIIERGELFDSEDVFDFDKEEVIEEDYSPSRYNYEIVENGKSKKKQGFII